MDSGIIHPLKIFDLAKRQGRYIYASAPMVRYSKLAFRQTVFEYGADICWTPMIVAKEFNRNQFARDSDFTLSTHPTLQPTTITQFGSNSPTELSRAASLVAPFTAGIDLNCGCPQSWAFASNLGAALMDHRDLVLAMMIETRARLTSDGWSASKESSRGRSVSVKIRVHRDLRRTVDFLETVLPAVDFLTIHPRTKSTPSSLPVDLEALQFLVQRFGKRLPILLSGDVFTLDTLPFETTFTSPTEHGAAEAASAKLHIPELAGLMAARALLANPALFAGHGRCPWEAVELFMQRAARAPLPFRLLQHHVAEMCGPGMGPDKRPLLPRPDRALLMACTNTVDLVDFLDEKARERGRSEGMRRA